MEDRDASAASETARLLDGSDAPVGDRARPASPSPRHTLADGVDIARQRGWLIASVATEIWVIVAWTCFLPLLLEQLARENGRLAPALELPCAGAPRSGPGEDAPRCMVPVFGFRIDSASFAMFTYSGAVLAQALAVVSISAIADSPSGRYRLFVLASVVGGGAAALMVLIPARSVLWTLAAWPAVASSIGLGVATVCLNGWLPHLARPRGDAAAIARLSGHGTAAGYAGGVVALVLSLIPIALLRSTTALQLVVSLAGLLWVGLSVIAARRLPAIDEAADIGTARKPTFVDGWRALFAIVREARQSVDTSLMLVAWSLLSDGFTTITSTAVLFGRTSLGMSPAQLVLVAILAPCSGAASSLLWPRLARRLGLRDTLQSVIVLVLLALLIPVYGLLGLLPVFRRPQPPPFGGLRTQGELYVLAVYFGGASLLAHSSSDGAAVLGPFMAAARATFATLIPPDRAGRYFALWSITDKSSFLGPLAVGALVQATGEIRLAFVPIAGLARLSPRAPIADLC